MQPVLEQIKQTRQGQGWDFVRFDHAQASGFVGQQGEVVVAGSDGAVYVGRVAGQELIDLYTGAKPPALIPGLKAAR